MSYYSTYIYAPLTSTAVSFTSFPMLISLTEKTRLCSRDIGSFNFSVKANKSKLSFFQMKAWFEVPTPWNQRRQWHPTAVLLPGKSLGQRSLVGCSPWGRWESDTTERLDFHFSLSCIGKGNDNPLQCSWLEDPRDGGASWAAVYGVAQSRTWLKQLSSSSFLK